jgi:hypothetical protein
MKQQELYRLLQNPGIYPGHPESVRIIQTHISYLVLTGRFVYKIKKPVNFGFVDFTTLEKRKYFCEQEISLNRRLAKDIYLGIVAITKKGKGIEIGGKGKVLEYAVKMKEFPQDKIMTKLVRENKLGRETVKELAKIIAGFHKKAETNRRISRFGETTAIKFNTDENFAQTKDFIGKTITREQFDTILNATDAFLRKRQLFEKRIRERKIRDCHGDLHTGNICVSDKIYIFDCIEFNERFRYSDVASDVAFLAMDLDFLGSRDLSQFFVDCYVEYSKDKDLLGLLDFYKCYRAYVRGKVTSFLLKESHAKRSTVELAKKYFALANEYAGRFSSEQTLFIVCGLTGTGKSYVADQIAKLYGARILRTDILRKRMTHTKNNVLVPYGKGLYAKDLTDIVYSEAMKRASDILTKSSCVIDATFKLSKHREQAKKAAANARFIIVHCICDERIVKQRLEKRFHRKSVSDGRWEIYVRQKKDFQAISEPHVTIDTSQGYRAIKKHLARIFAKSI